VAAAPDVVWAIVSDIDVPTRFSAELVRAEWLDGADRAALGARFEGHNHHEAVGTWTTTSTVVACEPRRAFAWAVGDPDHPSATWRFDLAPDGDGTHVTFTTELGPGPSGLTAAIEAMPDKVDRIIARRLREHLANMEATLDGIAALAEAG
jgi:hypothetical protein